MALEINFNNPHILRGYLDQAITQMGLVDVKDRLVVGSEGGLAFALFGEEFKDRTVVHIPTYQNVVDHIRALSEAVSVYDDCARTIAESAQFKSVETRADGSLYEEPCRESNLYNAGIGAATIASADRFGEFVRMIRDGKEDLGKSYDAVVKAANDLLWLQLSIEPEHEVGRIPVKLP